jgi:hypothetical protein
MVRFLDLWGVVADYHCLNVVSRVRQYKVLAIAAASTMMGHGLRTRIEPRIFLARQSRNHAEEEKE